MTAAQIKPYVIKWSSVPTENPPTKLARPLTLKFVNQTTLEDSQCERNRFTVRSHIVRERWRARTEHRRATMHSDQFSGNLSRDVVAKPDQKRLTPPGEDSVALYSNCNEGGPIRAQSACNLSTLSCCVSKLQRTSNSFCTLFNANSVDHFSSYPTNTRPVISDDLGYYFAAIATASIGVRQLPITMFSAICTELAAFTLSSTAFYHITTCNMLRMNTIPERTSGQTDKRVKRQRHRAVALNETRKAIDEIEATNQEATLWVVLCLVSDAFGNGENETAKAHLEGFKTLLRVRHPTYRFREDALLHHLVSDFVHGDPETTSRKLHHCDDVIRSLMLGSPQP